VISVTSSAVSLVRSERHHFCSNVCLCRCSVLTLFYCTTLAWSTTFRTNSHSSLDFNLFAFNPREYSQEYKEKEIEYNSLYSTHLLTHGTDTKVNKATYSIKFFMTSTLYVWKRHHTEDGPRQRRARRLCAADK